MKLLSLSSPQELAAAHEHTAAEVTRQYHAVVSGAQRIDALIVAEHSSKQALEAIEQASAQYFRKPRTSF